MTTLHEFLKTGKLGPLDFSVSPFSANSILGDPTEQSQKKNPLVLKYGSLELTFWRAQAQRTVSLQEIAFQLKDGYKPIPETVLPKDIDLSRKITILDFYNYLRGIDYLPTDTIINSEEQRITLASGSSAIFLEGWLRYLGLSRRRASSNLAVNAHDVREPSITDVENMFDEAQIADNSGIPRAALLLAWAGLEAVLRRVAKMSGLQGKIGIQPIVITRELQVMQKITYEEFQFIEYVRRMRTAAAHGLAPEPISSEVVSKIIDLARRLLTRNESNTIP